MDRASIGGRMPPLMMEIGLQTISMARGFTHGQMGGSMWGNGETTNFMVMVSTPGKTAGVMTGNILMIKKKGMVFTSGLTAESTKACGRMENNTERANSTTARERAKRVTGKKVKE